jgi:imidazoleglycerol-phosphate dehydratase
MTSRTGTVTRKTNETDITVKINLDGSGRADIATGNGMLDHLLSQLARHGLLDITVAAEGDAAQTGWHHTVEDTAICLGRSMAEAIGEGSGIRRMGHAIVPLDEALAQVAIDFSGRGFGVIELGLTGVEVGDLPGDLIRHFLHSFAVESRSTLHAKVLAGINPHHMAEATFKALAKSIRYAIEIDERSLGMIPSTKGSIRN